MRPLYARQAAVPSNITVCASPYQGLAANPVLTRLRGLQQCGSLLFNVPVTPPTTPPYYLIVYEGGWIPAVYPVTTSGRDLSWTVVYQAGQ